MARLTISLLGAFSVVLEDHRVTGFTTDKTRALLAYLALAGDRPVRREILAALLWPEGTEVAARNSLRQALFQLRHTLGDQGSAPSLLFAAHDTIQLSTTDCWVDVSAFESLLQGCVAHSHGASSSCASCLERLERAVALYRGEFLQGISVAGSQELEEWALFKQEELHRQALAALGKLVEGYAAGGRLNEAIRYARRQIGLEPWNEEAHRQLMLVLALSGQRSVALQEYESCRALLAAELDVEPSRETRALYESIRDGKVRTEDWGLRTERVRFNSEQSAATPEHPSPGDHSSFVARDSELAQMNRHLEAALAGQGRVVFVVGEAGSGKTALMAEFARRAMEAHADLVVASGNCNAQTGLGDPYLPFREILRELTGDVEGLRASHAISLERLRRLRELGPDMVAAILDEGPDLVDLFVPGRSLASKLSPLAGPLGEKLEKLLEPRLAELQPALSRQDTLFEQVTGVMLALAQRHALLLLLDDLQWADLGSISLLFHLGKRVAGSHILVLGAYRPEEMVSGQDGERHALGSVVNELGRDFGNAAVDLSAADGRRFVEDLLDAEPNRLDHLFRDRLYHHTIGHALSTVEILRGLQERGDLRKDAEGYWVEGPEMDWERLPTRVEAVIAERIARLPQQQQTLLAVASVEGEEFTAEVAARVLGVDARTVVRTLSASLAREHRLVAARSLERLGGQAISRYRFRHYLFGLYLYKTLDEVERADLHGAVGDALEALYGERAREEKALDLAHHFQMAGMPSRAIDYLLEAGRRATQLSALNVATTHFGRGLELLQTLPETPERLRQEIDLQLALGTAFLAMPDPATQERTRAYARAVELSRQAGDSARLLRTLYLLSTVSAVKAQYRQALDTAEQLLNLAQQDVDPLHLSGAHFSLGSSLLQLGELRAARDQFSQAIDLYDPDRDRSRVHLMGQDLGIAAHGMLAVTLDLMGYRDQALQHLQHAQGRAQALEHTASVGMSLMCATTVYILRGEHRALRKIAEALLTLASTKALPVVEPWGTISLGWAWTREGKVTEGLGQMRRGLEKWKAAGMLLGLPAELAYFAEACWRAGQVEDGLGAVEESLALVEKGGDRVAEAELRRLRGELLLSSGAGDIEPEGCFLKSIEVARQQEARLWELRAATSLARLRRQDRPAGDQEPLVEAYGWFTEGFDTPDLIEAKDLLRELRRERHQTQGPAAQTWSSPA